MITHPLDLASRLRRRPRNFDALFLINGGLIVLFFFLFGSRFVLAPGLGMKFELPEMVNPNAGAARAPVVISVPHSGMVVVEDGILNYAQLRVWLRQQAHKDKGLALLVRADRSVPLEDISRISEMATEAGFTGGVQVAMEPSRHGGGAP